MPGDTITDRLERLRREVRRELRLRLKPARARARSATKRELLAAALIATAKVTAILVLPFALYVRAAMLLYQRYDAGAWFAVAMSAVLTMGVVAAILIYLVRRFKQRARVMTVIRWGLAPAVAAWCIYAAFYLSRVNVKSDEVRSYYGSVHPILRIALSTIVLIDGDLVVTDMGRVSSDYARMGLPVNDRTRHYVQTDGWIHAVDLRTRERGELRNRAVQAYFGLMGFQTLRHVGTADHLHVQMKRRN